MASAVDSRLAYARLSAVATASRLPTATRGSNNSYTTSWDTTGLNQLIQTGQQSDAVWILRCLTAKGVMAQAFCFKALEIIRQIGTPEDLSAEAAAYQAQFGLDPAVQAIVA